MIEIILLIVGIVHAVRRPRLRKLSAGDFPGVDVAKFFEWQQAELLASDIYLCATWVRSVYQDRPILHPIANSANGRRELIGILRLVSRMVRRPDRCSYSRQQGQAAADRAHRVAGRGSRSRRIAQVARAAKPLLCRRQVNPLEYQRQLRRTQLQAEPHLPGDVRRPLKITRPTASPNATNAATMNATITINMNATTIPGTLPAPA